MYTVKNFFKDTGKERSVQVSKREVLVTLCLATLLAALGVSAINMALPVLIDRFDVSFSDTQWITVAYMMSMTATLPIAGGVSDKLGRRKLFLMGGLVFTISTLCCAFSFNVWSLVFFRAIQGAGAAMFVAVSMAIASDVFNKTETGKVIGLLGSLSAVGTGMGPIVGGLIVEHLDWQAIFWIMVPIGLGIFLLAYRTLPENIVEQAVGGGNRLKKYLASASLFFSIIFYTLAIKPLGEGYSIINGIAIAISIIFGISLLYFRQREQPLRQGFTESSGKQIFIANLAGNFLVASSVMSSLIVGPFYLTLALGLDLFVAGLVMTAGSFMVAACSNLAGRAVDRFRSRGIVLLGLLIMISGALGMGLLTIEQGLGGYLAFSITVAIGYGTYLSTVNTLTMNSARAVIRGRISGLLGLSRSMGLLTGASLMSVIFVGVAPGVALQEMSSVQIADGLNAVYRLASALLVTALIIQLGSILVNHRRVKAQN
ncbi:MFS transporter [Microbulbifer sp. OS29]|uniref:MFS transporter n=1 Tax=Microbulbifer okhotskensis TaxID=2926617 RepID=A0A9X2J6X2_9GAMM|nr:MFS transporter [Microbulbifer okhotskensis]MCO1335100.1 MFS transporter [Microbulbifer okhotskensis]